MGGDRAAKLAVSVVAVALSACGSADTEDRLTVFAAASLAGPFEQLADAFEDEQPGVDVVLNTAGSSALVAQIVDGAPADVVATADTRTMDRLIADGGVDGRPTTIARNRLAIVVPPGNPAGIRSLDDLDDPDLLVLTCAPEVPCGNYAAQAAAAAGVDLAPASLEANVNGVVTKVALGEADAGIAYVTDAIAAAGRVDAVEIAEDLDVRYPVAITATTDERELAAAFVDFVTGGTGRRLLADAGFEAP